MKNYMIDGYFYESAPVRGVKWCYVSKIIDYSNGKYVIKIKNKDYNMSRIER